MTLLSKINADFIPLKTTVNTTVNVGLSSRTQSVMISPLLSSYRQDVIQSYASTLPASSTTTTTLRISETTARELDDPAGVRTARANPGISSVSSETLVREVRLEEEETAGTPSSPIAISSTGSDSEVYDFFGFETDTDESDRESTMMALVSSPGDGTEEVSSGFRLTEQEKPKILAILGEDISSSGFSRKNTLFIRTIISSQWAPSVIEIWRKNIFQADSFIKIGELTGNQFSSNPRFKSLISRELRADPRYVITFTDIDLLPNNVYAYKVRVQFGRGPDLSALESRGFIGGLIGGVGG